MGLLRGMARTAVVAGTATAVSNRVSRRQARRWDAQDNQAANQGYGEQMPAPSPANNSAATDDRIAQLEKLADLKDKGVLTQAEFDEQKQQILSS